MRKQFIKIISLIFAILFICLTPVSSYFQIENQVYAAVDVLSSELAEQILVPSLITGGLVFSTKEAAVDTVNRLKQYLEENIELDLKEFWDSTHPGDPSFEPPPEDPTPNGKFTVEDAITLMMLGRLVFNKESGAWNKIVEVSEPFFDLVKGWIDDNFNVGDNKFFYYNKFTEVNVIDIKVNTYFHSFYIEPNDYFTYIVKRSDGIIYNDTVRLAIHTAPGMYQFYLNGTKYMLSPNGIQNFVLGIRKDSNDKFYYMVHKEPVVDTEPLEINIYGKPNVVSNPSYDWTNPFTNSKTIVLPVEVDYEGKPELDSDGLHKPSIGTEWWIDKEPDEVTKMNPSGIPEPDEGEDNETGIKNILKNMLLYFQNLTKDVADIKKDTKAIAEGNGTGNGNGDGTDIPTGFDWGDFKKFFDIFFIFIYFIIILILILVKLLYVVFFSLTAIPANSALFSQYPTILAGVNYIKNLQVGGLSITVHQAFEYVFTTFFFIFIIKQIRKLYDAFVYEEHERIKAESGISSVNYRHYSSNNFFKANLKLNESKTNLFDDGLKNPDNYENIKFKDYGKD